MFPLFKLRSNLQEVNNQRKESFFGAIVKGLELLAMSSRRQLLKPHVPDRHPFHYEHFYFFALMQKSNKKNQADLKYTVPLIALSLYKSASEDPAMREA